MAAWVSVHNDIHEFIIRILGSYYYSMFLITTMMIQLLPMHLVQLVYSIASFGMHGCVYCSINHALSIIRISYHTCREN